MFKIDIPDYKKIGLSVSGGADSALLVYYLMKNTTSELHFFTFASAEKFNRSATAAFNVITKCRELTHRSDIHMHLHYAPVQERLQIIDFMVSAVDSGIVDVLITGTTSIPHKEVCENFIVKLPEDISARRDPTKIKPLWTNSNKIYHPMTNLTKMDIANAYRELGILDTVFPLTVSCESLDNIETHCGQCWWCEERLWGFGRL